MSNIDFDAKSEEELAALEASPTGDLLRSTAQSLAPQPQFATRLEAHLRALPANKPALAGASIEEKAPVLAGRINRQQRAPLKGNTPGSGRIWRVASIGLGLAATLVLAFLLAGLFGIGRNGGLAGSSKPNPVVPYATEPTKNITSNTFLPDGQVRHITLAQSQVSTHTTGQVYTETTHNEEFWLAPGSSHPLMRTHVTVPMETWSWVDETNYYEYVPSQNSEIQTLVFDPKIQASILPDPNIVTSTLALPGAVSLGETTLNGRRALLIECCTQSPSARQSTPTIPSKGKGEPTPSEPVNFVVEVGTPFPTRYWIDLQTNQILQIEFVVVTFDSDVSTKKITNYIALDELLDRSSLPANFFEPIIPADDSASSSALRIGEIAPDFTLTDVHTGNPVTLASLRGKPVVLNFWGTWCPPCKGAMPVTQGIYSSVKDKAEIVGVSMGPRDDATLVKNYVDANKYTWTFVHDADYSVANAYKIDSVPTYVFIDANGVIKAVKVGAITDSAEFSHYLGQIDPQLTVANPMGVPSADHPGWFVFTPFGGGFSVLMPRNMVDPSSRDGWEFYGVREGDALTYIAAYRDLDQTSDSKSPTKRLELMVPDAATFMNGTARSETKSTTLDGNPGLELMLDRTDGRFMRARIYLVANRVLLVYAIAQNEQALFTPAMDVYLSSLTLLNK